MSTAAEVIGIVNTAFPELETKVVHAEDRETTSFLAPEGRVDVFAYPDDDYAWTSWAYLDIGTIDSNMFPAGNDASDEAARIMNALIRLGA